MDNTKTNRYGVARGTQILGTLYDSIEEARQQHAHISDTMAGVGLDPDVDVVSVEVSTTYSKPKVIKNGDETTSTDEASD